MMSKSQAKRLCYQKGIPMSMMNRLGNCHNRHQGEAKRVLCVCSAGLLRSPTTAWILGNPPFNFNTRAAGCVDEYALIPVDDVLIEWADEIVCMEPGHLATLRSKFNMSNELTCYVLNVEDRFARMDPELQVQIHAAYLELSNLVAEDDDELTHTIHETDSPGS